MQDKNKWFLALSVSVVLIGVALIGAISSSGGEGDNSPPKKVVLRPTTSPLKPEKIREHLEAAQSYEPPNPIQKVKDTIESHRARVEEAPDDPESPVLLEAMGNLYSLKLNDYGMAAYCYEQLLLKYPDFNKGGAYIGMITCYEKMGDTERAARTCNEMLKEFPEDSLEYKWATEKINLDLW